MKKIKALTFLFLPVKSIRKNCIISSEYSRRRLHRDCIFGSNWLKSNNFRTFQWLNKKLWEEKKHLGTKPQRLIQHIKSTSILGWRRQRDHQQERVFKAQMSSGTEGPHIRERNCLKKCVCVTFFDRVCVWLTTMPRKQCVQTPQRFVPHWEGVTGRYSYAGGRWGGKSKA